MSGLAPLVAGTGATWIAAAMSDADRRAASAGAVESHGLRTILVDVDPEMFRLAYDEVSNGVLWFAHHGLWGLADEPTFDASWARAWEAYREYNAAFAEAVASAAPSDATVLVQDYHLCLVAGVLATTRPDLRCVHFSHTPFAPPVWLRPLPAAHSRELLEGMAAHHACGFHSPRWAADFAASAAELAAPASTRCFVSPLASDPVDLRANAASPDCDAALAALDQRVGEATVIARVDRVELSKNLVRGFAAFEELLDRYPQHRGRVCFVAGAYPSREGVPAYRAYRARVEATVERINARYGASDWTPILLDVDDDYPRSLALLRRADVLVVNAIRDGLNLVASEGVLLSERDAVLCLSPETGAWDRFGDHAVAMPPFDLVGGAEALHHALTMTSSERARRAARLRALAEERTPADWLADQLDQAGRVGS